MPIRDMAHSWLTSDDTSVTLGEADDFVSGGRMIPFELERVWTGSWYDYRIATPTFNGRFTVDLGAGDDVFQVSSGDDDVEGGAGFDLLDFRIDTFAEGELYGWEFDLPYPRYYANVDLAAGTASWQGRDIVQEESSTIWDNGKAVGTKHFSFSITNWGGYTDSLRNFEAVIGSEGNDIISGSDGEVEFYDLSEGGSDTVNGRGGIDWIGYGRGSGGSLFPDDLTAIRADLKAGTVQTRGGYYEDYATIVTSLKGIENILGSPNKDIIKGDNKANAISGGLDDDTLDGRGGVDTLVTEFHLTDAFDDLLETSWEAFNGERPDPNLGVEVDLAEGFARDGNDADSIRNFENVTGTSRNDTIAGDHKGNLLEGGKGADLLSGAAGKDTLDGGEGVDTLTGGDGKDVFVITPGATNGPDKITDFTFGTDALSIRQPAATGVSAMIKLGGNLIKLMDGLEGYLNTSGKNIIVSDATKTALVELSNGVAQLATHLTDTIIKPTDKSIGTSGDDVLVGKAAADKLVGLDGNDVLRGNGGNDDLSGGAGKDRLLGGSGNDVLSGDAGNDVLFGDEGNDRLSGGDGADELRGGAGADTLEGGAGNDTLIGGAGKDRFIFGQNGGVDRIEGYERGDVLDISGFAQIGLKPSRGDLAIEWANKAQRIALVTLDDPLSSKDIALFEVELGKKDTLSSFLDNANFAFKGGLATIFADLGDAITKGTSKINHIVGSVGQDVLRGLGGNDILEGNAGNDKIDGGAGDDQISGGTGNDRLIGGAGNDKLVSDAGNDTLDGGDGNDMLVGGTGKLLLRGGAGNDTLVANGGTTQLVGGEGEDTFVLSKDALTKGKIDLVDFNPDEDRLLIDPSLDLEKMNLTIKNNLMTIESLNEAFQMRADLWDDILGSIR
ncbi:hypothetical protein GCM10007291_30080 [Gemmobacter nanjingensis]|uniref:Ca2+-binding protein, RTX toxin-related n=1 Tax=Gemmobacter nanjingensis TaxID=488454 RepID=A0ABQ3FK55_9RHOB|nr:calcium-binding protein [Gemmobacter nanjingensis]GHC27846.1 hypothetical protein GCM10007291_30080 [Gemmobacter nanjingensis]